MRDRVPVSGNTTTSTTCSIGHSNSSGTNFIGTNSSSSNMIGTSSSTALAAARVMDRPSAQPHQAALKCPRCDSTNTKFCYYNNYSLSQPRHFCKACKRYWTRGGTLRNVPVGGGCRKNKRVRKPPLPTTTGKVSPHDPQLPRSSLAPLESLSSSNADTSVFYSMPTLPNAIHFPSCTTAFALQPQVSALGAGVSSNQHDDDEYHLGLLLQQLPLMNDSQLFGSSLPPASAASLMASSPQHPKKIEGTRSLLTHEGLQDLGNFGVIKEVNIEGENTGINSGDAQWQLPPGNSFETFGSAAIKVSPGDSSYMYLKGAAGWPDAGSRWSSAAHLI